MVLLHLFDESKTRLADFDYIPECKSKNPRGLNELSLPLARMANAILFELADVVNAFCRNSVTSCNFKTVLGNLTKFSTSIKHYHTMCREKGLYLHLHLFRNYDPPLCNICM